MAKMNPKGAKVWIVDKKFTGSNQLVSNLVEGKVKNAAYGILQVQTEKGKLVECDSKYVLINLRDVLQKEVIFNIVNAKQAIYNIHGNDISNVTGKAFYKSNAIPLMYKTAEKLFQAEEKALEQGLTLKLYDAYRPYSVSKSIYLRTEKVANNYKDLLNGTINGFNYSQEWFLAQKASTHNSAIAVDITLVDLANGNELEMQSQVHDLSLFSVTEHNNENAKKLNQIMEKSGFKPLKSEWWHFSSAADKIAVFDFSM